MILGTYLISINIKAQEYNSAKGIVELPLIKYKAIRNKFLVQDSIIIYKSNIIAYKDSILVLDSLKFKSYDKQIESKNITIDTLSNEYRKLVNIHNNEKKDIKTNYKFWLGITIGVLSQSIIFLISN
jgi:hypothetical protein